MHATFRHMLGLYSVRVCDYKRCYVLEMSSTGHGLTLRCIHTSSHTAVL